MIQGPANDDGRFDDYVTFELDCSFDELIAALKLNGSEVTQGIITDGEFIVQAND